MRERFVRKYSLYAPFMCSLVLGCFQSKPHPIVVFAAGGIKPALDQISRRFEQKYGTRVEVIYGGGGEVLSKMTLSRRGDVFLAPEQWIMNRAREQDAIAPETIRIVGYMAPVIGVQKGNPKKILKLADLANVGVRVAITRPETTLLGKLAPEIFERAGLVEGIGKNIVTQASDPINLAAMLAAGHVDAAVLWHVYAATAGAEIMMIPLFCDEVTGVGEVQVAVSSFCKEMGDALLFRDFIVSAEGRSILEQCGYCTNVRETRKLCKERPS